MAIMKMYKGDSVCDADTTQVKLMEGAGWFCNKPEKPVEEEPEQVVVEETFEAPVIPKAKKTTPKKRRTSKKAE